MNIIGLCQGANLRIFAELVRLTSDDISYGKIGAFVADAAYFRSSKEARILEQRFGTIWLKEWQSLRAGLSRVPERDVIAKWQERLGSPSLWAGILADRRLIFGRYCKSSQDYRPRYSEVQLLGALQEALERVEKLFEEIEPDLVFGFVPVTLHEYLILRMAHLKGVSVRLLRSTKIENYVSLNDTLFGLSSHVEGALDSPVSSEVAKAVQTYITKTRERGAIYEGMHLPGHARRRFSGLKALRGLAAGVKHEIKRQANFEIKADPHNPGHLVPALHAEILQPLRAAQARVFIKNSARSAETVEGQRCCLFPLHFEPEIALQIYARPFQNQIEIARALALSLPADMKLLVKEHPRSAGMRPVGYYRKLLEIPNVALAEAERASHELVRKADLVAVVAGNIGLEAAVIGKPVIVLGETDYSALPASMVRTCHNLYNLSAEICSLLNEYRMDDVALETFLSRVVQGAVAIDLYSVLLGKRGRHGFGQGSFETDLAHLKAYVISRFDVGAIKERAKT